MAVTSIPISMLKTYKFKTNCKGDIHSSKTANIILPGLDCVKTLGERLYAYKQNRRSIPLHGFWLL